MHLDVTAVKNYCIVDGRARHGENGEISILVLQFDPEAVYSRARLAVARASDGKLRQAASVTQ